MLTQKYFVNRQSLLNEALDKYFITDEKNEHYLNTAIRYSLLLEGERISPILLFAVYEMFKGRKSVKSLEKIMPVAVALEMVHIATMVHDDLPSLNNYRIRKGKPSNHEKYDPATAILVGDALITKAFEVLTELQNKDHALQCIHILAKAISTSGLIGGQTVDLESNNKTVKVNILKYIYLKKNGALLQAATDMACTLCGVEENVMITLGNYALNLGLSYQIIDDILDDIGALDIIDRDVKERSFGKSNYSTLLGVEIAKKNAEKLLSDSYKMVQNFDNNAILIELINIIKERLP